MVLNTKPVENDVAEVFAHIYEENAKTIYYYALRILGDSNAAEDATHDVFLKAWKNFKDFRNESSPRTWLYRIAINHCRNLLKSRYVKSLNATDENIELENINIQDATPLKIVEDMELGAIIQQTIEKLPQDYREVLLLAADEHLSYQEIADLTHQTVDAVRGKLYRARKAFIRQFPKTK